MTIDTAEQYSERIGQSFPSSAKISEDSSGKSILSTNKTGQWLDQTDNDGMILEIFQNFQKNQAFLNDKIKLTLKQKEDEIKFLREYIKSQISPNQQSPLSKIPIQKTSRIWPFNLS